MGGEFLFGPHSVGLGVARGEARRAPPPLKREALPRQARGSELTADLHIRLLLDRRQHAIAEPDSIYLRVRHIEAVWHVQPGAQDMQSRWGSARVRRTSRAGHLSTQGGANPSTASVLLSHGPSFRSWLVVFPLRREGGRMQACACASHFAFDAGTVLALPLCTRDDSASIAGFVGWPNG